MKEELEAELAELASRQQLRTRPGSPVGLDFCSNDYLGLSQHPALLEAGVAALREAGAGGRAARLLGGGGPDQQAVEQAAARWLDEEDALLFPSGYQANLGLISALVDRRDGLVCDALLHASLIDGARLSRARVEIVPHGDLQAVEAALVRLRGLRRRLILTEGVYSMDGDRPDLSALARLALAHDAWLIVDEAHSAGLIGPKAAGAWAAVRETAPPRVLARLIGGGKALGVGGGLVVASQTTIAWLVNRARSFIYTTAPAPVLAGMLLAAIQRVQTADGARQRALSLAQRLHSGLAPLGRRFGLPELPAPAAAIVPWVLGDEATTLRTAEIARAAGFEVRAIRPPTVPAGGSRLRLVTHAHNQPEEVDRLIEVLGQALSNSRAGDGMHPSRSALNLGAPVATAKQHARPLFVIGTDTNVGKTVGSAWALAVLSKQGPVGYWKPVQTGDDSDTQTVRALVDLDPEARAEWIRFAEPLKHFKLPASPDQAASAEGERVPFERLTPRLLEMLENDAKRRWVVELAGGLLVPYSDHWQQLDWLESLRAEVDLLLVARSGLGTLNHTQLSLEALRNRGLEPRCLLLVGEPHPANQSYLERTSGVRCVHALAPLVPLDRAAVARAALRMHAEDLVS